MPDTKVENETGIASFDGDELFYVVDDPAGTPAAHNANFNLLAAHMLIPQIPSTGIIAPQWHNSWGSFVVGNDSITWNPFFVSYTRTFTRVNLLCGTAVASSKVRLGIWKIRQPGMCAPGTLLVDAGEVTTDVVGVRQSPVFSLTLNPGWYLAGINCSGSPNIYRATGGIDAPFGGSMYTTGWTKGHGVYRTQAYGAFTNETADVLTYTGAASSPLLSVA